MLKVVRLFLFGGIRVGPTLGVINPRAVKIIHFDVAPGRMCW